MADRGLSRVVHGIKFNKGNKVAMAQALERYVLGNPDLDEPRLVLLSPTTSRQVQSIGVNRELKARTSQGGHGDAFWSNALAVKAAEDGRAWSCWETLAPCSPPSTGCAGARTRLAGLSGSDLTGGSCEGEPDIVATKSVDQDKETHSHDKIRTRRALRALIHGSFPILGDEP